MAAQEGHTEALQVLISAGGDPSKATVVSAHSLLFSFITFTKIILVSTFVFIHIFTFF